MVKSKKLSKSSLAVIILSLLLILSMIVGMTAAWFTEYKTDNDAGTGSDVIFGKLGVASLVVTDASWTNAAGGKVAAAAGEGVDEVRGYYMPGDTVVGASVVVKYDASAAEATEKQVYYVVAAKLNGGEYAYYSIDNSSGKTEFAPATQAVLIDGTTEITLTANAGAASVVNGSNKVVITKANAAQIDNQYQGKGIEFATGTGFHFNGGVYELRMIQSTNLDADMAFTALTANWKSDNSGSSYVLA